MLYTGDRVQFNVAVIGGGVACGAFLTALALRDDCLTRLSFAITIFDPEERIGAGVTYGPRSGERALTITQMSEVLSPDLLAVFETWLSSTGRPESKASIAHAFLNRQIVGEFLVSNVTTAVSKLASSGNPVKHQRENVDWLATSGETFELSTTTGIHKFDLVILMNGTPKTKDGGGFASSLGQNCRYVPDLYYPGLESNIEKISSAAQKMGPLDLLIIGSNASAVEAVFMLQDLIRVGLVRLTSVSGSGVWPAIMDRVCCYPFGARNTTKQPMDMVFKQSPDLLNDKRLLAVHHHLKLGDLEAAIKESQQAAQSINSMSYEDRNYTINTLMPAIVAATRRMGGPYGECLETLFKDGFLTNIAARVKNINRIGTGQRFSVSCSGDQCIEADYIIDSTGWGSVSDNNFLLQNAMVNIPSLKLSGGGRGLHVNENFEASPGFMVFGPLLAGMNTKEHQLWHLESTRNIYRLAPTFVSSFVSVLKRYR